MKLEEILSDLEFTVKQGEKGYGFWFEISNEDAKILYKYIKELESKNKKLNLENQALFESINCNDNNMLARRYQKLQKENEEYQELTDNLRGKNAELRDDLDILQEKIIQISEICIDESKCHISTKDAIEKIRRII